MNEDRIRGRVKIKGTDFGLVEGFVRTSLGFRFSISSLHADNLSLF